MAFEPQKLMAGGVLYACFVLLPTAGLLLHDQGLASPIWERLAVGIMGVFAGRLIWHGIKGPDQDAEAGPQLFWGIRWPFFVLGAMLMALAWFSNLPQALAGHLDGGFLVFKGEKIITLDSVWHRIITMLLTAAGTWALAKGVRSDIPYRERKAQRMARKEAKRAMAQQYMGREDA